MGKRDRWRRALAEQARFDELESRPGHLRRYVGLTEGEASGAGRMWYLGLSTRCAQMRFPAIGCRGLLWERCSPCAASAHCAAASVPVDR